MVYRQLCICDVEPVYLKRLAAYLNRHPGFLWKIKTYTDLKVCLKERPEILLVSGSAIAQYTEGEIDPELLNSDGCRMILLEDDKDNPGISPAVWKYQSAARLYEDLLEILAEEVLQNTEVIGVYGPANGPEAEFFAEKLGKEYLKKGEVLIVPLTEFSIRSQETSDGSGIGEWFYYQSQKPAGKNRLSDWSYTLGELDYLRGFQTIYDRREVGFDGWRDFYREGLRKSRYSTVILVFDRLPDYMEMFMWCDEIYVKWGDDGFGNLRKEIFEKMTSYMEINELKNKLKEYE